MASINLQPTLKGKLLTLLPIEEGDFEELLTVASDPLIWDQHPERYRYQRDVFRIFFDGAIASKGALKAIDNKTEKIIGSSRFCGHDPKKSAIEIGYTFLARTHWGNGFNREMKQLMLAHAFQFVDEIFFFIGEKNFRSRRAIEKIGARLVRIDERTVNGAPTQLTTVYEIKKPRFREAF